MFNLHHVCVRCRYNIYLCIESGVLSDNLSWTADVATTSMKFMGVAPQGQDLPLLFHDFTVNYQQTVLHMTDTLGPPDHITS